MNFRDTSEFRNYNIQKDIVQSTPILGIFQIQNKLIFARYSSWAQISYKRIICLLSFSVNINPAPRWYFFSPPVFSYALPKMKCDSALLNISLTRLILLHRLLQCKETFLIYHLYSWYTQLINQTLNSFLTNKHEEPSLQISQEQYQ